MKPEEICEILGCGKDMFCYGGRACYSLCVEAEKRIKEEVK